MSEGCNHQLFERLCGMPVVRDGKCEQHKVERRKNFIADRRTYGSSDTPPSCGNAACKVMAGQTIHHKWCDEHGPGWA